MEHQHSSRNGSLARGFTRIALSIGLLLAAMPSPPQAMADASALTVTRSQAALADAAAVTVTSPQDVVADDGVCTLREAIAAATGRRPSGKRMGECRPADEVRLPAETYALSRGELVIAGNVRVSAAGGAIIEAAPGADFRLIRVDAGEVSLTGLTLRGGSGAQGAAIFNAGNLTLRDMAILFNSAKGDGGAVYNAKRLAAENVTLSGNRAGGLGGALYHAGGEAALNNVTIASNTAGDAGGVYIATGVVAVQNSIIAANLSGASSKPSDCRGALSLAGPVLLGSGRGCDLSGAAGAALTGVDPGLDPLQRAGDTWVHPLRAGSRAADAGSPAASGSAACAPADQRGVPRPRGGACDLGAVESSAPGAPVLIRVARTESHATITGRLTGAPNTTYRVSIFPMEECDLAWASLPLRPFPGAFSSTTNAAGHGYFTANISDFPASVTLVAASARDDDGSLSLMSACVPVGIGNDSWVRALRLEPTGPSVTATASISQVIDVEGQSRWFKFRIEPGSRVYVALSRLPANYDLTVYKDISATFAALANPGGVGDLALLGAEFAPDAFSPDAFSPDAFSPDAFSPDAFSPDAFSPDAFSPDAFSPDAFSPDAFSPDAFSPDAFSPDAFSPDAFSPDAFSPDAFSPDAFSPDAFSPENFANAQSRSLIAVSAFDGTASEGVALNTWTKTGDFYVRVRGRNGAFEPANPFQLDVVRISSQCTGIAPIASAPSLQAVAGGFKTVILTDWARLAGSAEDKALLRERLEQLAARPEVLGVIVDVGADARVAEANAQANVRYACPYAKNLVADEIKAVADRFRALNPLEYVVIVGNDDVIPFFRHPDQAMLANERNYVPPVRDSTASQASLRWGYLLSQDRYGASQELSVKDDLLPLSDLAVGRLVETPSDALAQLDAYLSTPAGVLPAPRSAFVSGYDFLTDAAEAIASDLTLGLGAPADTLIAPRDMSPLDPGSWTADQLKAAFLGRRHDIAFLAGHFSAASALAADYQTRLLTSDVIESNVDLVNALIYSAGCHSGYNTVDAHGVPGVTREPDWAQTFARKGATLIAGTGYQYGDTDFIEYSERLYLEFTRQLRAGQGPVAIGKALVNAKRRYLADTPSLRPIHEKAYLISTLFGLPMLKVDMPGVRYDGPTGVPVVTGTTPFATDPGRTLGLRYVDLTVTPELVTTTVRLTGVGDGAIVTATYLSGSGGHVVNPAEPVLPLEVLNVSVPGYALRGVGLLDARFADIPGMLPLVGAATTEMRGVHAPFASSVFYPVRPWSVNYFGAVPGGDGATLLKVTPAQYRTDPANVLLSVLRRFDEMRLRLYYSDNVQEYANGSVPAASAAPAIVSVNSSVEAGALRIDARVLGNPAAGLQQVWAVYQAAPGELASLDLVQDLADSTRWSGTLTPAMIAAARHSGAAAQTLDDVRFVVQAVNGVGLVSLSTNIGEFFAAGQNDQPISDRTATSLRIETPAASGAYGTQISVTAVLSAPGPLRSGASELAGRTVGFRLGAQSRQAQTDADGRATVSLPLLANPGALTLIATFTGDAALAPSAAEAAFEIVPQATSLELAPAIYVGPASRADLVATLRDAGGRPLGHRTVFFSVVGEGGTFQASQITDFAGRATYTPVDAPPGSYAVTVVFGGAVQTPGGDVSLDDDRYGPSSAAGGITIVSTEPTVTGDAFVADEDAPLVIAQPGVLGNDAEPDDQAMTAVLVSSPAHGALALAPNGGFVYTGSADFNGADAFTYRAVDKDGLQSAPAVVSITVRPVNDPPRPVDDYAVTTQGVSVTVDVLINDVDVDGDTLHVSAIGKVLEGQAYIYRRFIVFEPAPGFVGTAKFAYFAMDRNGPSTFAYVTVKVNPPSASSPDAPMAEADCPSACERPAPTGQ